MNELLDPIMISALEHYSYCPRQCALIHVERVWDENLYTMRGRDVHEKVHSGEQVETHCNASLQKIERNLPIWSRRLNLTGKADMVEFHDKVPYPVEYKSGRHRTGHHEVLQLCAQAVCLEEMLDVKVEKGAIYWHGSRERKEIVFTDAMRAHLEEVVAAVHEMISNNAVPPPVNDKRCKDCSLKESCMPHVFGEKGRSIKAVKELFVVEGGR